MKKKKRSSRKLMTEGRQARKQAKYNAYKMTLEHQNKRLFRSFKI